MSKENVKGNIAEVRCDIKITKNKRTCDVNNRKVVITP